jgi:hypothetical protein
MPDKKISELPSAITPLAGNELLPLVQGNVTKQVQVSDIKPANATETVAGIAEIATQAEVNVGIDDTTIVTPAKLASFVNGVFGNADLQAAYNNSSDGTVTTDATRGAVKIKGGTGNDTSNIQEFRNNANELIAYMSGTGKITAVRGLNSFVIPTNVSSTHTNHWQRICVIDLSVDKTQEYLQMSFIQASVIDYIAKNISSTLHIITYRDAAAGALVQCRIENHGNYKLELADIEILYNNSTSKITIYKRVLWNWTTGSCSILNSRSTATIIWDGTWVGTSLSGEVNDSWLEKSIVESTTGGSSVSNATETVAGIAEIATQAEVNAGTDDTTFVTPAKLASYVGGVVGNAGLQIPQSNIIYVDTINGVNDGSANRGDINKPYLTPEYVVANVVNTGTFTSTTTSGSATLTAISDAHNANLVVGQCLGGTGILYETIIIAKGNEGSNANTVTISKAATTSGTSVLNWITPYTIKCNGSFVVTSNLYKDGFFYDFGNSSISFGNLTLFVRGNFLRYTPEIYKGGSFYGTHSESKFHSHSTVDGTHDMMIDINSYYSIGTGFQITGGDEVSQNFVALGQTSRVWSGMAAAPNGNIYACVSVGLPDDRDIYMQTAGTGDFISLNQTARSWYRMAAAPNGNIYACEGGSGVGDIYMQTAGAGDFIALGQTNRQWTNITVAPNGNVYACVYGGDIYMQTAGTGNFIALGQTSRQWFGMTAAPNGNIYAAVNGGDIYMQTAGTGNFIALNQTSRQWYGMTAAPNGNVYACVYSGNIYMQTAGTGDFITLTQTNRQWLSMTAAPNGNVYASVYGGDIYMQTAAIGNKMCRRATINCPYWYAAAGYAGFIVSDVLQWSGYKYGQAGGVKVMATVGYEINGVTESPGSYALKNEKGLSVWVINGSVIGSFYAFQGSNCIINANVVGADFTIFDVQKLTVNGNMVVTTAQIDGVTTSALNGLCSGTWVVNAINQSSFGNFSGNITFSQGGNHIINTNNIDNVTITEITKVLLIANDVNTGAVSGTISVGLSATLIIKGRLSTRITAIAGTLINDGADLYIDRGIPAITGTFTNKGGNINLYRYSVAESDTDSPTIRLSTGSFIMNGGSLVCDVADSKSGLIRKTAYGGKVIFKGQPYLKVANGLAPLQILSAAVSNFIALGQTSRNWVGMAAASNGNVYACVSGGDIYMQTGGVGNFVALGQTSRDWHSMAVDSNNNVYACVFNGDIYKQTGGIGDFVALGQVSRSWYAMAAAPNGDVYACVFNGDIYTQTGGVGNFVALGQTNRIWRGITAAPNGNVYACVVSSDIYMQTGGVGNFVALGQTSRNWRGMTAAPNGDVYACVLGNDIYKQTGGVGNFVALGQTTRNWQGMAATPNGNVYASVNGDIYMQNAGTAKDIMNFGVITNCAAGFGLTDTFSDTTYGTAYAPNDIVGGVKLESTTYLL